MLATAERRLLLVTITLMGLIAGFFYAYSCSVMVGLARTDDLTFVTTMQWINATVRNVGFAPSFFGSLLCVFAVAGVALWRRSPARWWITGAAVCYAVAFGVTTFINVPMNETLAAAGPADAVADLAGLRRDYEDPWVRWNLVRTVLSTLALVALARAAQLPGRTTSATPAR